eukprot:TRINITY_DN7350_c1_g1_i3.p1 TRINITY_DN7350_c1_g1~~TRINITY_DN7350_c1_g1_i3.p1  ORF type:complete len:333 (-),score=39.44 TRINITY_DN7350_c1_g1_i3:1967-2965(-)
MLRKKKIIHVRRVLDIKCFMSFLYLRLVRGPNWALPEVIQLGDDEEVGLSQPKPRILVEQPDGSIMLGEDPLLVQVSEDHPFLYHQQAHFQSMESGLRQTVNYEEQLNSARTQYRMRRNAFLLMIALDLLYLSFSAIISFRNISESNGDRYVSENSSLVQNLLLVGRGSPGIILFAATVDVLGAFACFLYKPAYIAIYVILMSCILAVDAFTGLGPLLVVRVLLIFMAFRIRKAMFVVLQQQELLRLNVEREDRRLRQSEEAGEPIQEHSFEGHAQQQNAENLVDNILLYQSETTNNSATNDQNNIAVEEEQLDMNRFPRMLVRQNAFRIRR